MKKKSICKKLLCLLLSVGCIGSLAGCGGKEDGTSKTGKEEKGKDFVYTAEYQSVDVGDIGTMIIKNGTVYYVEGNYNEETDTFKQEVKSLKIGETQATVLPIEVEQNSYINCLYIDEEGNFLTVLNTSEGEEEITENYFLKRYAQDGSELQSQDITEMGKEMESFYIQYLAADSDGNIYLAIGDNEVRILDKDGKQTGRLTTESWLNSMFTLPNGKVAVTYWGNEGNTVLAEIDAETKKLGKTYQNLPDVYNGFTAGEENTIIGSNGNGVFSYNMETESNEELLNWVNCDINGDDVRTIAMLEDGRILAISQNWDEEEAKTEFIYLTKKAASEITQKETITLGALYLDSNVKKNVINFNKTNEKYRIEVKEYSEDDWEVGMTQMNNEVVSGNGPDIIDLSFGSTDMYIAKGILEDLTPYVERDLKREDYVENVFSAYEVGGKLYGLVPSFTILTVMGKTSDVGEKQGWTIDDVMALMNSKPEGTELFNYCSKETILYYMCHMSLDSFINWETGECSFDDGYFEKILEFANQFPKEVEYNEDDESVPSKIQGGKLLLQEIAISDMQSYQMYAKIFGEPVTFIGFPSNGGTGSYINVTGALGINAKAENKEGAWEFLKSFLTEEYQKEDIEWYFPVLKSALDAKFEKDMTPEYTEDENGQKIEQPKTTWNYDDFEVEIYAATQEEVDAVKALIDSVDGVAGYNEEIGNIITEEAAAYFEGQKTAKDVADIIQSRVKIYVNENR